MTRSRLSRRAGFTLLEVLLASALAIVLMAALYVALDVQLRLASAGRESIEQATLNRYIVMRLEADLSSGLGPVAPPIDNSAKNTARGSGSGMGGGAAATGAAGASGASSGSTSGGSMTGDGTGSDTGAIVEEVTTDTIPFTAGVIGSTDQLTIFAARVAGIGKNVDDSG